VKGRCDLTLLMEEDKDKQKIIAVPSCEGKVINYELLFVLWLNIIFHNHGIRLGKVWRIISRICRKIIRFNKMTLHILSLKNLY